MLFPIMENELLRLLQIDPQQHCEQNDDSSKYNMSCFCPHCKTIT